MSRADFILTHKGMAADSANSSRSGCWLATTKKSKESFLHTLKLFSLAEGGKSCLANFHALGSGKNEGGSSEGVGNSRLLSCRPEEGCIIKPSVEDF